MKLNIHNATVAFASGGGEKGNFSNQNPPRGFDSGFTYRSVFTRTILPNLKNNLSRKFRLWSISTRPGSGLLEHVKGDHHGTERSSASRPRPGHPSDILRMSARRARQSEGLPCRGRLPEERLGFFSR